MGDRPDRRLLPVHAGARLRCRGAAQRETRPPRSASRSGNLASPLLAEAVGGGAGSTGGAILLALIAAVAFATILAVVAGLTLTSASSVAHDLYNSVIKKGKATEKEEIRVARIAAGAIGGVAILLAIPAQNLNIAFLVALAFAVAASANLPAIVYNMFWKRFNTRGAVWSIYGGLISAVGLVIFSPVVSGKGLDPVTGKNLSLLPASIDISLVPAGEPGHRLDPARLLLRMARVDHVQGADCRGALHRARGPRAHRRGRRAGHPALTQHHPGDREPQCEALVSRLAALPPQPVTAQPRS